MPIDLFFWKKKTDETVQAIENPVTTKRCICGSGKWYSECHELEFALPIGEKPDGEY